VFLLVLVGISCLVDRKSSDFACDNDDDCDEIEAGRECKDNFCVKASCPSVCDSCSVSAKTCQINCSGVNECSGGVACPAGYACTFNCSKDCTPVDCSNATSCVVTCSSASAECGPLSCGAASPCTCGGTGTCK
jgi:hypothetical protein